MMVKPVTFMDIWKSLLDNIKSIPEVSQFDWRSTRQLFICFLISTWSSLVYWKNYAQAVTKFVWFVSLNALTEASAMIFSFLVLFTSNYTLNNYLQFIWILSHAMTILGTVGYGYNLVQYSSVIFCSMATYLLLTFKHCQLLIKQCHQQLELNSGSAELPIRPPSAFSVKFPNLCSDYPLKFTVPSSIALSRFSSYSVNSDARTIILSSQTSINDAETIVFRNINKVPKSRSPSPVRSMNNYSQPSPFATLLRSENTHILAMLCLFLVTPNSWLKLISINIYSLINIINFVIMDIFPDKTITKLIIPLFKYLEVNCLQITAIIDFLMVFIYIFEYLTNTSQKFYPILIYTFLVSFRFENSVLYQQVANQFFESLMYHLASFPVIVGWLQGFRLFIINFDKANGLLLETRENTY